MQQSNSSYNLIGSVTGNCLKQSLKSLKGEALIQGLKSMRKITLAVISIIALAFFAYSLSLYLDSRKRLKKVSLSIVSDSVKSANVVVLNKNLKKSKILIEQDISLTELMRIMRGHLPTLDYPNYTLGVKPCKAFTPDGKKVENINVVVATIMQSTTEIYTIPLNKALIEQRREECMQEIYALDIGYEYRRTHTDTPEKIEGTTSLPEVQMPVEEHIDSTYLYKEVAVLNLILSKLKTDLR